MADEVGQDPTPVDVVETPQTTEATPSFAEFSKAREERQSSQPDPGNSQQVQQKPEGNGHPAWDPIRQALGDDLFDKIKSNLHEFDNQAQKRITEVNSKYEPYKQFAENGVAPDALLRAYRIVQGIDSNPLQAYQALEQTLRQQNLLPAPGDIAGQQDEDEDPRDAEIRSLREQQEAIAQYLQEQQAQEYQARLERDADTALDQEIQSLRSARPNMTREEEGALIQQYALHLRAGNFDVSLEKLAAESDAQRNRILSQPRPNDFAPRIPGSGGASPTGVLNTKDPSQYDRAESQALLADMLKRANQS